MDIELSLRTALQHALQDALGVALPLADVALQLTRKEFEGDYTWVPFPFTVQCNLMPAVMAERVGAWLRDNTNLLKNYNIVNGFLNICLSDHLWLAYCKALCEAPHVVYHPPNGRKVVLEFSSPNTNKPLHLGHLRNNFLGNAVANTLQAAGYQVYKVNLVNDRGIHICKSMIAYQQWGHDETPESTGLKGDHLVGKYYVQFEQAYKAEVASLVQNGMSPTQAAQQAPLLQMAQAMLQRWEAGDPAVLACWKKMNSWVYAGFEATYHQIGSTFDKTYRESETYLLGKKVLYEGLAQGIFYQEPDGSIWIDLHAEGLDKKILLRSDGTSVYITQDMGTVDLYYHDFKPDQIIYVVGNEQDYHFAVLVKVMQHLKRPYANHIYHLSYGMVDLPSGKMKSREGTTVDADTLIDDMVEMARMHTKMLGKIDDFSVQEASNLYHTLAMGALKYFLLRIDAKKRLFFDPHASIDFQGDTGPYIQYTYARIATVLRKAGESGIAFQTRSVDTALVLHPLERAVMVVLGSLSRKLQEAAVTYSPAIIAQHALEVAKAYNRLYAELAILQEQNTGLQLNRLQLSVLTARSLAWMMNLLGIDLPARM